MSSHTYAPSYTGVCSSVVTCQLFYSALWFWFNHYDLKTIGLLAGLVASVITKWRANDKYSYGYVRAEILAGFINGLFLLFISFFIFSEAVERLVEPPEVKHERLLPVSIAGIWYIINQIIIFLSSFRLVIMRFIFNDLIFLYSVENRVCCQFDWNIHIPTWWSKPWPFTWR